MESSQAAQRHMISFFVRFHHEERDLEYEKTMDVVRSTIEIQPINRVSQQLPTTLQTKIVRFGKKYENGLKVDIKDLQGMKIFKNTYQKQTCTVPRDGHQHVALLEGINEEDLVTKSIEAKRKEEILPVVPDVELFDDQFYCIDIYPTQMKYTFSLASFPDDADQETPPGINREDVEKLNALGDGPALDFLYECADRHAEKGQVKEVIYWFEKLVDCDDAILECIERPLYDQIREDELFVQYIQKLQR